MSNIACGHLGPLTATSCAMPQYLVRRTVEAGSSERCILDSLSCKAAHVCTRTPAGMPCSRSPNAQPGLEAATGAGMDILQTAGDARPSFS
jgi:hypothetical protein